MLKQVFVFLGFLLATNPIHSFGASIPQGMCIKPNISANGVTIDKLDLYYCSQNDVPTETNLTNMLLNFANQNNFPLVWFDINIPKRDDVNKKLPTAYTVVRYGYVDENRIIHMNKAEPSSLGLTPASYSRLREQFRLAQQSVNMQALKNGKLHYEKVSPQPNQNQNAGPNSKIQNKINNLERRLRGY